MSLKGPSWTSPTKVHACQPASEIRRDTCQQDAHPTQSSQGGVFEPHVHQCRFEGSVWSPPALSWLMFREVPFSGLIHDEQMTFSPRHVSACIASCSCCVSEQHASPSPSRARTLTNNYKSVTRRCTESVEQHEEQWTLKSSECHLFCKDAFLLKWTL